MRRVISRLQGILPESFRRSLLGSPSDPSRFANAIHAVLNRLPGEEVTCLPCQGVLKGYRMKVDWSRHRAFVYGTWEPAVVKAIREVVEPGTCALDIGAHIGFYTLILSRMVGPRGRVLAFEPLPWNFSVLSDNIRLNNCTHVEAINKALLDRTCDLEADIRIDEALPGSVAYFPSDRAGAPLASAVSLDDFLAGWRAPVHFMKVDVEGSESLVLKGASKTIQSHHPALIIEVHHGGSSADASPVIGQLHEWGYRIRWLSQWKTVAHLLAT